MEARTTELGTTRRNFLKGLAILAAGGISATALPGNSHAAIDFDQLSAEYCEASGSSYWEWVKAGYLLDPQITHLNTGTEGAMSRRTWYNFTTYLKEFATNPMQAAALSDDYSYFQRKNRERVATFLKARPDEIVLTGNTTDGMNIVLHGLDLAAGDEVVTTLHDHSAATAPLQVMRDRRGIIMTQIALPVPASDPAEIVAAFRAAITPRTKVLCFCHINYTTGLRMPVKELCDLARSFGLISIVDGAHALGMLDFSPREMGCDFYSCAGHKWLNGPPGTGILYVRDGENNPHRLWPMLTELYGYPGPVTTVMQVRGQQNTPAFRAVGDAMDYQAAIGKERIEQRTIELSSHLKAQVVATWGDKALFTADSALLNTGITAFNPFPGTGDRYNSQLFATLVTRLRAEYRIYIRSVNFKAQPTDQLKTNALRVSTHIFNSHGDVDRLLAAIRAIA